MTPDEFRRAGHAVVEQVASYLERLEEYRVLPAMRPGEVRDRHPEEPPEAGVPFDEILADFAAWIEPNVTHWQHPGFMAYFPSVASGPGILGEWLAAGLNSNVMFWKNAPASTEIEQVVVDWLRRMLGLPGDFDGMLTDTASISTLLSVVAARHAVGSGRLRLYASEEAHSSVDKAAVVAGIGLDGVRKIPTDREFRMDVSALAAAIEEDRARGDVPFCVVATLGTTAQTAIDPAEEIAVVCAREKLWLHVDAAYGGAAALVPDDRGRLAGWERADSIVVNPHKWMFTPFDASLLLFRAPGAYRDAFRIVPEYLAASKIDEVRNYSEYGIQLGRRFRALKLWTMIRYFGRKGFEARIREHRRLAEAFAGWVDAARDWERTAPYPFATVCFRHTPPGLAEDALDRHNAAILEGVNARGRFYLSHARLRGRFTLRVSIGNPRQTEEHVAACWRELCEVAAAQ